MSRAPAPDPDDQAACHVCGKAWIGEHARRNFARHINSDAHYRHEQLSAGATGAELRYGWAVRQIGGIELGTPT